MVPTIPHINSETNLPPPIINVVCKYLRQFLGTSSWHYSSNILQHWVGGRNLIYLCKVDHSRISVNISRKWLGLNNLCEILQIILSIFCQFTEELGNLDFWSPLDFIYFIRLLGLSFRHIMFVGARRGPNLPLNCQFLRKSNVHTYITVLCQLKCWKKYCFQP